MDPHLGVTISENVLIGVSTYLIFQPKQLKHQNLSLTHRENMEAAYKTLTVRPELEYAAVVWNPHLKSHFNQLEKVQRTVARWTCMRWKNTSHVGEILVSTYQICQPKQLKPLVFSTEISRWHKRNQIGCIQNACAS